MTAGAAPRVSIVLPTHNRADVLPFAIESVLAQSCEDFELLIAGDGCTDNTAEVVRRYADARMTWFDLPKAPGIGYANRNVALRQARGQVIAYMAHDDVWFPDHLAHLLSCLDDDQIELAYSLPLFVSTSGDLEPMVFNLNDAFIWKLWHERLLGYLTMANVAHKRSCLERYGYWNENLRVLGDWELWTRIARREPAPNFAYWPVPTSLHFVASWRRYGETRPRAWWRRLRDREGAALAGVRLELADGITEQEAAWSALKRDPMGWTRAVRLAVQVDLDRRGAFRLTLSDLLEAARRGYRYWRTPKRSWNAFSPPDTK